MEMNHSDREYMIIIERVKWENRRASIVEVRGDFMASMSSHLDVEGQEESFRKFFLW